MDIPPSVVVFLLRLLLLLGKYARADDACEEPLDLGHSNCYSKAPGTRYYYNYETGNCVIFNYLGCEGNENRFLNEDACLKTCAYSHGNNNYEEDYSEYGDVYVYKNGIVDDIHLDLFTGDKLSKGWFSDSASIIHKNNIRNQSASMHKTTNESDYAIVPTKNKKAQLWTKIMSLISLEKFSDLSSTVDSTITIFDSKHYRKIVKKRMDWINMRFTLHDSFEMEYGGRLLMQLSKSTNNSIVGISDTNITIIPLMSDRHYSINTGEEVVPPGLQGGVLTTLEIILIVVALILAILLIVLAYRHWSLKSHVKQYNLNNVSTPKPNPMFSGSNPGFRSGDVDDS